MLGFLSQRLTQSFQLWSSASPHTQILSDNTQRIFYDVGAQRPKQAVLPPRKDAADPLIPTSSLQKQTFQLIEYRMSQWLDFLDSMSRWWHWLYGLRSDPRAADLNRKHPSSPPPHLRLYYYFSLSGSEPVPPTLTEGPLPISLCSSPIVGIRLERQESSFHLDHLPGWKKY